MTTIETTDVSPIDHNEAMALQADELERTIAILKSLSASDWNAQTDCPDWDVRLMYLHVLGACEAGASTRENVHQLRAGRSHRKHNGGPLEAGLSHVQVHDRIDITPDELVSKLEAIAPKCVKGRRRTPGIVRKYAKLSVDGPVHEKWPIGYLIDVIYLRDLWMHRVDLARATGRPIELTADHDGRIIADVVAEWARRHGRPFSLELTGPAGGSFTSEPDSPEAEHLTLDAVEFCRVLAGRAGGTGLMTTIVPF